MIPSLRLAAGLLALLGAISPAQGAETRSPSELVRAIQIFQDQIAAGSAQANRAQRELLPQIAGQLLQAAPEVWKEMRNARAAVAFVLNGGDVRVLKKVVGLGPLPGVNEKLVNGVLAYGEGRDDDAAGLLIPIDARTLDPSLAGNVAFVQAELMAKKDPKKALALLDDARLLSPGTLVEEAALRRQVGIVAATGDFDRLEGHAGNYLRRFPKSVYSGAFRRQFAADVAGREDADDAGRMARVSAVLDEIDVPERRDAYLAIAREALVRGKVELARLAASSAMLITPEDGADRRRARLYEAAASVAGSGFAAAAAVLEKLDRSQLAEEDAELFDAAALVATEVGREPAPGEAAPAQPSEDVGATFKAAAAARRSIARVDDIVTTASK